MSEFDHTTGLQVGQFAEACRRAIAADSVMVLAVEIGDGQREATALAVPVTRDDDLTEAQQERLYRTMVYLMISTLQQCVSSEVVLRDRKTGTMTTLDELRQGTKQIELTPPK